LSVVVDDALADDSDGMEADPGAHIVNPV
jgi:hypothetical protein